MLMGTVRIAPLLNAGVNSFGRDIDLLPNS